MTARRAAGYCGGALLLVAWFSSAGGVVRQTPDPPTNAPTPVETSGTETLVGDIQAQALRLKTRLASAPAPQEPFRNAFAYRERVAPRREHHAPVEAAAPPPAPVPLEPAIELIGVTTTESPKGQVRTAVISTLSGDLFLVKEGDQVASRYRVTAVGTDAVELSDMIVSGAVRRLALKN